MDSPSLDSSHGARFAAKVRNLLGVPIVSDAPGGVGSFWLLAAFSRSHTRLSEDSVGLLLQLVLGGEGTRFAVVQVEDFIFKFAVANKAVGLAIYNLAFFACPQFKVFFHLWNPKGISAAAISTTLDQGPRYDWQEVKSKKDKRSYAEVTKSNSPGRKPPLTGANRIPVTAHRRIRQPTIPKRQSAFVRLNLAGVPDANFQTFSPNHWQAKNTGSSRPSMHSANSAAHQDRLKIWAGKGASDQSLLGRPGNGHHSPGAFIKRLFACTRCLSSSHSRFSCRNKIRCFSCGFPGHIMETCPSNLGKTSTNPTPGKALKSGPRNMATAQPAKTRSARWVPKAKDTEVSSTVNAGNPTKTTWFSSNESLPVDPSSSSPPRFASFPDFKRAVLDKGKNSAFPSSAQTNSAPAKETTPLNQETPFA
ncbi:unnamed protein product [Urochloa humidicola]